MSAFETPGSSGFGRWRIDPLTGEVYFDPGNPGGWPEGVSTDTARAVVRDATGAIAFAELEAEVTRVGYDFASLFLGTSGEWWLDAQAYTDSSRTTPVTSVGDPIGSLTGRVNNHHLIQTVAGRRPLVAASGTMTFNGGQGLYIPTITLGSNVVTVGMVLRSFAFQSVGQMFFELTNDRNTEPTSFGCNTHVDDRNDIAVVLRAGIGNRQEIADNIRSSTPFFGIFEFNNSSNADVKLWISDTEHALVLNINNATDAGSNFISNRPFNVGARGVANGAMILPVLGDIFPVFLLGRSTTAQERADIRAEVLRLTGVA